MGNWEGEWVIRKDGQTIDASWSGGRNTDIIDIKSIEGNHITLYRHGNKGYYTGTISPDGLSMSGTASWYSPGKTWTATRVNSRAVGPLNENLTYNGYITFSNNSGESIDDAIVIHNAKTDQEGVDAEYYYLEGRLGKKGVDWSLDQQYLNDARDRHYDVMDITLSDGRKLTIYFDITEFFGKL